MKTLRDVNGPSIYAIAIAVVDGNELQFKARDGMIYLACIESVSASDEQATFQIKGQVILNQYSNDRVPFTAIYRLGHYDLDIEDGSDHTETMPCAAS
jgi:hypothetical protein